MGIKVGVHTNMRFGTWIFTNCGYGTGIIVPYTKSHIRWVANNGLMSLYT